MLVIVLVNLDRRRCDDWEGWLSGATHDASVQFATPGNSGATTTHIELSGPCVADSEDLGARESSSSIMSPGPGLLAECDRRT